VSRAVSSRKYTSERTDVLRHGRVLIGLGVDPSVALLSVPDATMIMLCLVRGFDICRTNTA